MSSFNTSSILQTVETNLQQAESILSSAVQKHFPRSVNFTKFEQFLLLNILVVIAFLFFLIVRKISFRGIIDRTINIIFKTFYAKGIPEKLESMKKDIIDTVPEYGRSKLTSIPYHPPVE